MIRILIYISLVFALLGCSDFKKERIFLDEEGIERRCYTSILPTGRNADLYMLLLPGFGESADDVLFSTDLPSEAAKAGIAVFIPLLQDGPESYGFSMESQQTLLEIMEDIKIRYALSGKQYCIGGFSMGGAAAVKFAEIASVKPSCLFAIDSPLDYERFCYSATRDVKIYRKGLAEGDSTYIKLLEDISPIVHDSPYLLSDTSHNVIKSLADISIRYYIEPAEKWWLDNRQTDVLGLNIIDGTAFINDLRLLGNQHAELIVTSGKGYRVGGNNKSKTYHPHSWSIADSKNLIGWILKN